ncbi:MULTISPECIES: class I SAM-dependent methyltransferase [Bradyrhizobium]|uniref:class I SAM-dependent methyltransferase n=1 Tax=Bradyrhizobium TaxID=374 RepID=UPI00293E43EE|nr:class I SAM-dependent methyltransferase [Bradyrhizobium sp. BWC-3-1]WOH57325.1 class I SAM-dependent methyltransferase [Bradyrhizobium sp. BWC-3-1]
MPPAENPISFSKSPSPDQVRAYYDAFSSDRMLSYRLVGNARIEKAIQFFIGSLGKNEAILDVGCGIGIATEAMAKKTHGPVLGIDISEQNIWYAKKTVGRSNLNFVAQDALSEEFDPVALLGRKPSTITMCDVIEHIPETSRQELFQKFSVIGGAGLKVHLTFPTATHLEYLEEEKPSEIQIIDNKLRPEVLAIEAAKAGLAITYFKMVDIWRRADYAHCSFERLESLKSHIRTPLRRSFLNRVRSRFAATITGRIRKRRYIDKVFEPK